MPVPRFFANGFKKVELIGDGCARFTFSDTRASEKGSSKRVTGEVIVPISALSHMIAQASMCMVRGGGSVDPERTGVHLH